MAKRTSQSQLFEKWLGFIGIEIIQYLRNQAILSFDAAKYITTLPKPPVSESRKLQQAPVRAMSDSWVPLFATR